MSVLLIPGCSNDDAYQIHEMVSVMVLGGRKQRRTLPPSRRQGQCHYLYRGVGYGGQDLEKVGSYQMGSCTNSNEILLPLMKLMGLKCGCLRIFTVILPSTSGLVTSRVSSGKRLNVSPKYKGLIEGCRLKHDRQHGREPLIQEMPSLLRPPLDSERI